MGGAGELQQYIMCERCATRRRLSVCMHKSLRERERANERERDEKIPNGLLGRIFSGRVRERPASAAVKGKLFNSTELTLRNCSRRRAPACFTKRQINLGTYTYIYIHGISDAEPI